MLLKSIDWGNFGIVLLILAVLSLVFTVLVLLVHKFCTVEEDPKIGQVAEKLSGANCGGCGFAGCADFAKALVEGRANVSNCVATSKENKQQIAAILGVEDNETEPMIAVVHCCGEPDLTTKKLNYIGGSSCEVKNTCFGGDKVCSKGCLGGGTCEINCTFNAIKMNNGVAKSDKNSCTGCGTCVKNCPKQIIGLIPKKAKVYVACSSICKGKEVMDACKNGCIGCGLCAKNCPNGAITMVDNLPVIDYSKCTNCLTCVSKCPRKSIKQI